MSIEDQITQILEDTRDEIRARMDERGENATGRTSLSIRVQKDGSKIRLIGGGDSQKWGGPTAPIETLELGRGPGGDWKRLRPIIVRWTIAKGFKIDAKSPKDEESKRWAISTIIAKNIVENGTARSRQHEDIYSTPVNEAAEKIRSIVTNDINELFHEIVTGTQIRTIETIKTNFK